MDDPRTGIACVSIVGEPRGAPPSLLTSLEPSGQYTPTDFLRDVEDTGVYESDEFERIRHATGLAAEVFAQRLHKSGVPLIEHALRMARMLLQLEVDAQTVVTAVLHDLVQHSDKTYEDIEGVFGSEAAGLVRGLRQLRAIRVDTETHSIEDLDFVLLEMSKDLRVAIVRLLHRLSDLENMGWREPQDRRQIATETRDIYVPVARRLGMGAIVARLEDLAFQHLEPGTYRQIQGFLADRQPGDKACLELMVQAVDKLLQEHAVTARVVGRIKTAASLWRKMVLTGKSLEALNDRLGIRIILNEVLDCYNVLGLIHTRFTPVPGNFDDYVGLPKPNGYRSLHTCIYPVRGITYKPVEIQIRTWEMNHEAEFGAAAHWKYKQNGQPTSDARQQLQWIRNLIQVRSEFESHDGFVKELRKSVFEDLLVVFDETGKTYHVPRKSTASDYARTRGIEIESGAFAKVNGRIAGLDWPLADGDTVEICYPDRPQ